MKNYNMAQDEINDDFDEELEQEMAREDKKPSKETEKRNDTGPDEETEEVSQERYQVFVEPEKFGIMDTVTNEPIAGSTREIQTTPDQIVALQLQAKQLNEQDQIKNSLGA